MKVLVSSFIALFALGATAVEPKPAKNEIIKFDPTGMELTITDGAGGFKTYRFKPTTEVFLNSQRSTVTALQVGMIANVTAGDPGVAARITATSAAKSAVTAKPAPATAQVKFSAQTSEQKPFVHGTVKAGQKVTVTPVKVWWEGGGTQKGKFTDWQGYPGSRNMHGMPWMALIAQVGSDYFNPANNALAFTIPTDGVLVFFCNDDKPEGNEGSASVTVTVSGP